MKFLAMKFLALAVLAASIVVTAQPGHGPGPGTPAVDCTEFSPFDWDCCTPRRPCSEDEGDCDSDRDCAGSLVCGPNNCHHRGWDSEADCCTSDRDCTSHESCNNDESYCSNDGNCYKCSTCPDYDDSVDRHCPVCPTHEIDMCSILPAADAFALCVEEDFCSGGEHCCEIYPSCVSQAQCNETKGLTLLSSDKTTGSNMGEVYRDEDRGKKLKHIRQSRNDGSRIILQQSAEVCTDNRGVLELDTPYSCGIYERCDYKSPCDVTDECEDCCDSCTRRCFCDDDPTYTGGPKAKGMDCSSYAPGEYNHGYCAEDGVCAICCSTCLLQCKCVDNPDFRGPVNPRRSPCSSYAPGGRNHGFCEVDGACDSCCETCLFECTEAEVHPCHKDDEDEDDEDEDDEDDNSYGYHAYDTVDTVDTAVAADRGRRASADESPALDGHCFDDLDYRSPKGAKLDCSSYALGGDNYGECMNDKACEPCFETCYLQCTGMPCDGSTYDECFD